MTLDDLKTKHPLTRDDIHAFLATLGKPGQNRQAKIEAITELEKVNPQGVKLEDSLESYDTF